MHAAPEAVDRQPDTTTDKLRDAVAGFIGTVAMQGEKAMEALGLRASSKFWVPQVDVLETDEQVIVTADLPGIEPAAIEIVLTGNMLTLKGEQAEPAAPKSAKRSRQERPPRKFQRSIPLPAAVDSERVAAQSSHGVLTITLAKLPQACPTHIRVSPGSAAEPAAPIAGQ